MGSINSNTVVSVPLGLANWYFNFQYELQLADDWDFSRVTLLTPAGVIYSFKKQSNGTLAPETPTAYPLPRLDYTLTFLDTWPTSLSTLKTIPSNWQLLDSDGNTWIFRTFADPITGRYNIARPISLKRLDGTRYSFRYGSNFELLNITDGFGRTISFDWLKADFGAQGDPRGIVAPEAITAVHLPDGTSVGFTYEDIESVPMSRKRLVQVEYKDSSNVTQDKISYAYENATYPMAITKIRDRDDVLRWSVTYDSEGRATSSSGPDGADNFSVTYAPVASSFTRTVTNPLGKESTYNYTTNTPYFKVKLNGVSGAASSNCPASASGLSYGADNLIATSTDEEGRVTKYMRNTRGLPTQIQEAYGTSDERTTNIAWDSTFNIPTQVVTTGLTSDYTYNANGLLTGLTQTDTTTHTAPYSTNGETRSWAFGYTLVGTDYGLPENPLTLTITNQNAESSALTGWTSQTGAFSRVSGGHLGTYSFGAGSAAESVIYQDVLLPSTATSQIDAGYGEVTFTAFQKSADATQDNGSLQLTFFDASNLQIGSTQTSDEAAFFAWTQRSLTTSVPVGARTVRIGLRAVRISGTTNDVNFDDVTLTYSRHAGGQVSLLTSVDGPLPGSSDTVNYTYDANGYLATITNELGHVTQIDAVDGRGLPLDIEDENGIHTTLTYDIHGQVLSITRNPGVAQSQTLLSYNAVGQITEITLPSGGALSYEYNSAKRLTGIENSAGERIEFAYDAMGNVTSQQTKTSGGAIVENSAKAYDELGRLLHQIGATSQTTSYGYDKVSNLTSITDPRSNVYSHAFDRLNRLVRETQPTTGQINMAYTTHDDVASFSDQRSLTTSFVRNGFGDIIREVSPDRGTTDYVRNKLGEVTSRTDARGVVTNFSYDAAGRLTSKNFPSDSTEDIAFTYDDVSGGNKGVGRLTGISGPAGIVHYSYDARGNVTFEHHVMSSVTYDSSYAYDGNNDVIEMVYPSGRVVTYARDNLGRVTSVTTKENATASTETVLSAISWRPFGPASSLSFGNGLTQTLGYDLDGQLTDIQTTDGGTAIQDLHLAYDAAGNITDVTDNLTSSQSESFDYDVMNRLTDATGAYGDLEYGYDFVGNRTQRVVNGSPTVTQAYSYDTASNHLLSVSDGATMRSFGYSAAGNVTSDITSGGLSFGLAYNDNNRLESVTQAGAALASYVYDAYERRVIKSVSGSSPYTRHFHYDQSGQLIAESDATGAVIREYIWLGSLPIALVDHSGGTATLYFIHADHLGAPQKVSDASKVVVWSGQFEPFGEVQGVTGALTQLLMFPGQYYDSETGTAQNWHRQYDARTGRYLEADPLGLGGGANLYAYVGGNPLGRVDPEGLWQLTISGGDVVGGIASVGYNSNQLSIGFWGGAAAGFAWEFDPRNGSCHEPGLTTSFRGQEEVKLGRLGGGGVGIEIGNKSGITGSASIGIYGAANWSGSATIGAKGTESMSTSSGFTYGTSYKPSGGGAAAAFGYGGTYYFQHR